MEIEFAFDNKDVLDILEKRGKAICEFEFKTLKDLD